MRKKKVETIDTSAVLVVNGVRNFNTPANMMHACKDHVQVWPEGIDLMA